ncbi:MAG TPA: SMP-30/gluconolactonase/LRE family protein [Pirellulales bacterium]|nr:SMP-30/gluconolactonase/LRE family protein [Pirellulales bacterium]
MSRRHFAVSMPLSIALIASALAAGPTGESIVPEGAKLELLYTRTADIEGGLTEGAAVAPDGSIYFTDIPLGEPSGLIVRFDPTTMKNSIFTDDSRKANGLMFDAKGRLLACEGSDHGGQCISRWDVKTRKREVVADKYMGKRFNAPNDLAIDLKGRIYFTDPRYLGDEPRELEQRAVYRIETNGDVVEVTHDVEKPNGIAISPDQKTLYVGDHNNGTDRIDPNAPPPEKGAMTIYAFPLGADGLVAGARKTVYDFGTENGCDGMCLDVEGNLYLTSRGSKRPGVLVISPEGKEVAHIPTNEAEPGGKLAEGLPSNCDFGIGKESNMLYVTIDKSLCRIRLKVDGWHIPWAKSVER